MKPAAPTLDDRCRDAHLLGVAVLYAPPKPSPQGPLCFTPPSFSVMVWPRMTQPYPPRPEVGRP